MYVIMGVGGEVWGEGNFLHLRTQMLIRSIFVYTFVLVDEGGIAKNLSSGVPCRKRVHYFWGVHMNMSVCVDNVPYVAILPYLTPMIVVAEAEQHGCALLRAIDDGTVVAFRSQAPGELHLMWGMEEYSILSTDHRGQPIWFRVRPDERFQYRVEKRRERGVWDAVEGDRQLLIPASILLRRQIPWEK
jgi:hypothetical protein